MAIILRDSNNTELSISKLENKPSIEIDGEYDYFVFETEDELQYVIETLSRLKEKMFKKEKV